jgi:CheY-like chemotaxis protein
LLLSWLSSAALKAEQFVTIVIVDDTSEDLLLMERVIRNECKIKNPITLCSNGNGAVEELRRLEREQTPALILVDLVMAPVSGLDVLSFWKSMPYADQSVMVMVSALTDFKTISEGYRRGAKTFVLKPFSKEDMLQLLGTLDHLAVSRTDGGYIFDWKTGSTGERQYFNRDASSPLTITA